jgi:SAM-dependent methyltransferase
MIHQKKTDILITLMRRYLGTTFRRILVVGCGSGLEAVELAGAFKSEVVGIDLDPSFDPLAAGQVELRIGDATRLDFSDGYFDLIYSFHVLEHIPQYSKALSEMARVLADGGGFLIGTPNRARWIGYLGSQTASWTQKLAWNWTDWRARFRGKFRNEYGAHAGFLPVELQLELKKVFKEVEEITLPYYLDLYSKKRYLIQLLDRSGLGRFLFPAIYFIGRK